MAGPDTTDEDGDHSAQGDKRTEVEIDPRDYVDPDQGE
jgi:hypothetical protein